MANAKKQRLFEVFEKVNKINLKEWYDDDYGKQPKQPRGIGGFGNVDWQIVHEQLMVNTELLAAGKTSEGNLMAANLGDFTDYEGMLSPEELKHLEEWGLVYIHDVFPIIEEEQYKDYNTFKAKAAEIWTKEPPQTRERGMVDDAPFLRGNEPMSEADINAIDWEDNYTNENLVAFLKKWLGALRFYDDGRKAVIIAKALEDEFPTLRKV